MPNSSARHKLGETCPRCGVVHKTHTGYDACVGHSKKGTGRACRNPPHPGASVCIAHGAASPKVKAAAQRRETERKVADLVRRFGGPLDIAPTEALLDTVKWTAGYVGWLRERVGEDAPDIPQGAWDAVLGEWSDRLVKVCAEAIRAGIEERRVRLAEAQGALVAEVIRKILGDLDLTPEQAAKAGNVVPLRLREATAS